MKARLAALVSISGAALYLAFPVMAEAGCQATDPFCYQDRVVAHLDAFEVVAMPKIATPAWLVAQTAPAQPATRQVSYSVATKGTVTADVDEFKATAASVYNNPLGWTRLGVSFVEVPEGGDFTLWLAEASQVPSFSPAGCDSTYSCAVGRNVIINQDRWLNGSDSWNNAGGVLADYRAMVLNHELGHWLGHGHRFCGATGAAAPLMQQQSISIQGCTTNPWPLANEMYSPKLGIRS
jgi:hypothetical protein